MESILFAFAVVFNTLLLPLCLSNLVATHGSKGIFALN